MAVAVSLGVVLGFWLHEPKREPTVGSNPTFNELVWNHIVETCQPYDIHPGFVYAIACAESSLRPDAKTNFARGIMQLSKNAWQEVSDLPYDDAWDWQTNISVGVDYLHYCRKYLEKRNEFSYPLLSAAYRFGPAYVARSDYDLKKMKKPKNTIYKRLFSGDVSPVEVPDGA